VAVEVEEAASREVREVRRITGDVRPWEVLPLSFKVGGRVESILVDEGDVVEEGQVVAELDARDYALVHELAKVQVEALRPHEKRAKDLAEQDALPQSEYDEIESKLEAALVQKSQARAQLSYARLRSPMGGVVIRRDVTVGDMVGPERPALIVADLFRVKVVLPVSQRDLHLFEVGMQVPMTAEGLESTYVGTVHQVGFAADPNTRTFPVTVEVANPDLELRAGMLLGARVEIEIHEGIFLPLDAVSRDADRHPMVLVVEGDPPRAEVRPVETGVVVGELVEIVEGLEGGERVVVRGLVTPGELVTVVGSPAGENEGGP
jgi:RND family efflux transporter MFP subunit